MSQRVVFWSASFLLAIYFLVATLWNVHLPRPNWDEAGIAAPAHKLASTGIYGNDLAAYYYQSENYNYEYMPLYAVGMALFFRIFGTGIVVARLLSVFCGLLILGLTYGLARRWYGAWAALATAGFLLFLRWGVNGVPLIVYSRVARYDIMVPVWILLATFALYQAVRASSNRWFWVSGVAIGLAAITHILGAFVLVPFGVALVWHYARSWRRAATALFWVGVGFCLPLVGWAAYVLPRWAEYQGQNLRHTVANRFDLFNPQFYWGNIVTELDRYQQVTNLLPGNSISARIVIVSLLLLPLLVAWIARRRQTFEDKLLIVTPTLLALLLMLLISYKVYSYILIFLPFIALQWAMVVPWLAEQVRQRRWVALPLGVGVLVVVAAGVRVTYETRQFEATLPPSTEVARQIQTVIPQEATVLMSQHLWFGWHTYQVHSLFTPFFFADARYYPESPMTLEAAFLQYRPDYLIGGRYVEPEAEVVVPLYGGGSPSIETLRADFTRIRTTYCPVLVGDFTFEGYDRIPVYRCQIP